MATTIIRPKIESVSLTPNPVDVQGVVTVDVSVGEEEVPVYVQSFYANQFYSGGFFIGSGKKESVSET